MNARAIPRAAVDSTLKLVRLPIDSAVGLLPENGRAARPAAKLAIDRADATVRALLSTILRDPVLRDRAEQQRTAAEKREQALRLREEADRKTEMADSRLQQQHEQAERQREQAKQRAKAQRERADRKAQEKKLEAAEAERRRLEFSDRAAARVVDAAGQRAADERLHTLDMKADAVGEKEHALAANDQASRLRDAARQIKTERKTEPDRQAR